MDGIGLGDVALLCLFALLAGGLDAVVGGLVVWFTLPGPARRAARRYRWWRCWAPTSSPRSWGPAAAAVHLLVRTTTVDRRQAAAKMAERGLPRLPESVRSWRRVGPGDLAPLVVLVALVAVLGLHAGVRPALGEVEALRLHLAAPAAGHPAGWGSDRRLRRAGRPGHRAASWCSCWSAWSGCRSCTPSATAKAVNTATNLAALLLFAVAVARPVGAGRGDGGLA